MDSTFRLAVGVPRRVKIRGKLLEREDFYSWAWKALDRFGIAGVHEGTILSEEAAEQGFETESWTLDAAEAPRERDWVASQRTVLAEFYFTSLEGARKAAEELGKIPGLEIGRIEEQKPQDWDAQWKASFLNAAEGVRIPPFWRVLPPWVSDAEAKLAEGERPLRINPGAGFGTGTHETTQLCLRAIAEAGIDGRASISGARVLDFGSGSGILAIGAALLGAEVDAVEIDPLAIDNARENAKLNSPDGALEGRIQLSRTLESATGKYRVVIANILRPVLLEFATELVSRLDHGGTLILSGLIESDVAQVSEKFSALIGVRPEKRELAEWRSLVWRAPVR